MKNKFRFALVLTVAMTVLFTGCNSGSNGKITKLADLEGRVIGAIAIGVSKDSFEKMIPEYYGIKPKEVVYYNRLPDAIAAVLSGKVDAVHTPNAVADYYLKRNGNLKALAAKQNPQFNAVMAVRTEDTKLRDDLNKAITTLQENGTLKKLQDEWITNLPANNEPVAQPMPIISGARTVYVGVCGDWVPMDYIAANGRPAGYNVALLSEIGKLLNINFEFVSLESQARATALQSKKIDVVFIQFDVQYKKSAIDMEIKKKNWILTGPYFSFTGISLLAKK